MKSSGILNIDSQTVLEAAFGSAADEAWLVTGHHNNTDRLTIYDEGHAGTFQTLSDTKDLYYCVSEVSGSRRNPTRVRVLVIDDVGKEIDRETFSMLFPLEASYVVESSKGSYQCSYVIEGGMDPDDYKALRLSMKAHPVWGGAHGIDPQHIFRLPQGTHTKPSRNGFRPRLALATGKEYAPAVLWKALAMAGGTPAGPTTVEWDLGEEALAELVRIIPNPSGLSREDWVGIAHGIAGAGGDFEIFEDFSSRWDGPVDHDETVRVWETLPADHKARGGRLREMAEAADPDGFSRWKSKWGAKSVFDDGEVDAGAPAGVGDGADAIEPVQRAVAESIFKVHGGRFRFNHDSGCWHHFQGVIWEPLPKSIKAGFRLAERWAAANEGSLSKSDFKAVTKANFYDGVENILRQRLVCRQEDFDRDAWLLGTPGGTVDLRTGALEPARAGDFISKVCAVTPTPNAFCPRWMKFVGEVSKGDLEVERFLQQWFGYCLTGDTREQMFLFLYGPGGNGKSVLVDTMAWVMGTYFVKPVADLYIKKTGSRHLQEVAMLAGARMVSMSEVPAGASWDEGRLKDHTGGGRVTANFMRENSFSFVPQFKLTVQGNHQPTFPGGINPAIQRRFKMLLMDFVPKVVDRTLEETFRKEGPGILRWALLGLSDPITGWCKTGLLIPQAVSDVTDEYVRDQDVFAGWLGDRTEKKQGDITGVEVLWKDWIEYRNAQGDHSELYASNKAFVAEMERRGFKRARTMTARGFWDIILKSNAKSAFSD